MKINNNQNGVLAAALRRQITTNQPRVAVAPPQLPQPPQCQQSGGGFSYPIDKWGKDPRVSFLTEGNLPTILPLRDGDYVNRYARDAYVRLPQYATHAFFSKGATYSPRAPLSTSGTKAAGQLALSIALAAASGSTQGNRYLVPGIVIEITSGGDVAPGVSRLSVTGTFEDGQAWSQTDIELAQGNPGTSAYIIVPTRETDGGAYPSLCCIQRDLLQAAAGGSIALTAAAPPNDATAIVPTDGIRSPRYDLSVAVDDAITGTFYRVATLTPTQWYFTAPMIAHAISMGG